MPKPPLPRQLETLIAKPNPAVIATLRPDGSPHTAATWYDWDDGHMLVNMDKSRRRLAYLREDPRVSVTVVSSEDWYIHVTVMGRVASLEDDTRLADIDRLSLRYTGRPYPDRERRRVSAWIEVDAWHAWARTPPPADG